MTFVLTLVASDSLLSAGHLAAFIDHPAVQAVGPVRDAVWLAPHKAADIPVSHRPDAAAVRILRDHLAADKIDLFVTAKDGRRKKLLLADMDSTIVTSETLDEIAAHAGLKDKIAAITERAMRGELDFHDALRERVGMLKDLNESALSEVLSATQMMPGADVLVRTMAAHDATCVLVSGGFTFFTGAIAMQYGFHHHHGNILGVADGKLTGMVEGDILDKNMKKKFLHEYAARLDLTDDETIALGDGANDLPMLQAAGLGIGYHPKPLLKESLDNCILYGDLTAALYAQGFTYDEFRLI